MGTKRMLITQEMREHPFVHALLSRLGNRVVHTTGMLRPAELGVDTIGPRGMSLRAYSRLSSNKRSISLLNITGGTERVYFISERKMLEYLPGNLSNVKALSRLVGSMGGDMEGLQWDDKTSITMSDAIARVDAIADVVLGLGSAAQSVGRRAIRTQSGARTLAGTNEDADHAGAARRGAERLLDSMKSAQSDALWCGSGCTASAPCDRCAQEIVELMADARRARAIRKMLDRASLLGGDVSDLAVQLARR